jgi:hypothetical protein
MRTNYRNPSNAGRSAAGMEWLSEIDPLRWKSDFINDGIDEIRRTMLVKNTILNRSSLNDHRNSKLLFCFRQFAAAALKRTNPILAKMSSQIHENRIGETIERLELEADVSVRRRFTDLRWTVSASKKAPSAVGVLKYGADGIFVCYDMLLR